MAGPGAALPADGHVEGQEACPLGHPHHGLLALAPYDVSLPRISGSYVIKFAPRKALIPATICSPLFTLSHTLTHSYTHSHTLALTHTLTSSHTPEPNSGVRGFRCLGHPGVT